MGNVNPQSYRANYSGLSAFDIAPEGRLGNLVTKPYEAIQREKEANSIQNYRLQQKKKLEQDMAMKQAQQYGDVETLNKLYNEKYQPELEDSYLGDGSGIDASPYDTSNVGTNTLRDYLSKQQSDISNAQSDRTHKLNVGKTTKPETLGDVYIDKDGKAKQRVSTFNPKTNIYDETSIDAINPIEVAKAKASGKTPKTIEPFESYHLRAATEFLQKQNKTVTEDSLKAVMGNPAFKLQSMNKWKTSAYDKSVKAETSPTVKLPNTKTSTSSYSVGDKVNVKGSDYRVDESPDGKSSILQYSGDRSAETLQDHVSQLEKKDQEHYAKILKQGNDNFLFDKFSADKLYNLAHRLSGGNPKVIREMMSGYVNSSLRAGGLGSAIATSAFVPSFDYADFNLDSKTSKKSLDSANMNLYAWALQNGNIKIDTAGGINEKTGQYDFVLLDKAGNPVPKEKVDARYKELYKDNKHAVNAFSIDASKSIIDKVSENKPLEVLKSGADTIKGRLQDTYKFWSDALN